MKIDFVSIVDKTGRTSSLMVGKHYSGLKMTVIGVLPHDSEIAPKTLEDCDKLIAFLQEWRKTQI